MVKQAFEFYASGSIGLNALVEKMYEAGLRSKNNKKISRGGLVCILKNPFYMGLIRIEKTSEMFAGIHAPVVSKKLFDAVQNVFAGKRRPKTTKHFFLFRRVFQCRLCENLLIAERQKGYVYYRCHTKQCVQKALREELIEEKLLEIYERLQLSDEEFGMLQEEARNFRNDEPGRKEELKKQLTMELSNLETRLAKLADAYMDEVFDKETYLAKKNELILKQKEINEKLNLKAADEADWQQEFDKFIQLLKSLYLSYKSGDEREKREMVEMTLSNCTAEGKSLSIKLKKPLEAVLERERCLVGSPTLATTRTFKNLYLKLRRYFINQATTKNAEESLPLAP